MYVVVSRVIRGEPTLFPHKSTLFHTAAHFRGCFFCGQVILRVKNLIFPNEVKHLREFLEATYRGKAQANEALSRETESEALAPHMCFDSQQVRAESHSSRERGLGCRAEGFRSCRNEEKKAALRGRAPRRRKKNGRAKPAGRGMKDWRRESRPVAPARIGMAAAVFQGSRSGYPPLLLLSIPRPTGSVKRTVT